MGLNEAAGYAAAYVALGLGLTAFFVRETREHARPGAGTHTARADGRHDHLHAGLTNREVFGRASLREPALSAASQAGMVNNLNDGLAMGLFPILFVASGLSISDMGMDSSRVRSTSTTTPPPRPTPRTSRRCCRLRSRTDHQRHLRRPDRPIERCRASCSSTVL